MLGVLCRHELKVDSWEDVPFSNETELAKAVTQTPVIVAICCGPAIDDWHHYAGKTDACTAFITWGVQGADAYTAFVSWGVQRARARDKSTQHGMQERRSSSRAGNKIVAIPSGPNHR
jgi:hypothetical protein